MSTTDNLDQTYLPPIKQHARERWHERFCTDEPLDAAWFTATPVDAPAARCSHARLHQPTDALMLVRDGWLRTVLVNDGRIQQNGLVMCDACDDLVDPITHEECPSCGASQPAVQTYGRATLIRGGENR